MMKNLELATSDQAREFIIESLKELESFGLASHFNGFVFSALTNEAVQDQIDASDFEMFKKINQVLTLAKELQNDEHESQAIDRLHDLAEQSTVNQMNQFVFAACAEQSVFDTMNAKTMETFFYVNQILQAAERL